MSGQAKLGGYHDAIDLFLEHRDRQLGPRRPAWFQIAMVVITIAGACMIATTGELHRWGFVVSLAAQPFWFVVTKRTGDWGALLCVLFFTAFWAYGIYNRFTLF